LVNARTTDERGYALSDALELGTYYVQEIESPDNTHYLSSQIYEVVVTAGENTEEHPNIIEQKVYDDPTIVDINKYSAEVYKTDGDNSDTERLENAELQILDENGNEIAKWTSGKDAYSLVGILEIGKTYTLHEISAPTGYRLAEDIKFTVPEVAETQQVDMVDELTVVELSKTDVTGDNELEGALIQVIDKETGETVEEWTSTSEKHIIKGLEIDKTYIMHESLAPIGYAYASDIEFTISNDDEVKQVVMKDELTKVVIKKVDESGKLIKGAKLKIQDEDGNDVLLDSNEKNATWVTDGKAKEITGLLEAGKTYTLIEVKAPSGYKKADPVTFTVPKDAESIEVQMVDKSTTVPHVKTGFQGYLFGGLFLLGIIISSVLLFRLKRKSAK
jgi:hypothetical protein